MTGRSTTPVAATGQSSRAAVADLRPGKLFSRIIITAPISTGAITRAVFPTIGTRTKPLLKPLPHDEARVAQHSFYTEAINLRDRRICVGEPFQLTALVTITADKYTMYKAAAVNVRLYILRPSMLRGFSRSIVAPFD